MDAPFRTYSVLRSYPLVGNWYVNGEGYLARGITTEPGVQKIELQHRVVMSEILGRPLHKFENVHHKNGNRSDNRPENLELWVTKQPYGQRPEDLVAWAKEILDIYDSPKKVEEESGSRSPNQQPRKTQRPVRVGNC